MMKRIHWVLTVLIILLGLVHTGIGLYCKHLNEDTLWFIGSGIAIIFAGLFNLLMNLTLARPIRIVTVIVNAVVAALFILAMQVISGVHVYVGLALFVLAGVVALLSGRYRGITE